MIGMISGGISSIVNGISGAVQSSKNYKLQKEQFEYQKQLQERMFEREDTAVQRQAADMAKAGLSKTLAAGGGASSGPVVQTQAPQMDIPAADLGAFNQGYSNDIKDAAQKAQASLIDEQLETQKSSRAVQDAERKNLEASALRTEVETLGALYDIRQSTANGIRRGDRDPLSRGIGNLEKVFGRFSRKDVPGDREGQAVNLLLRRIESRLGSLN